MKRTLPAVNFYFLLIPAAARGENRNRYSAGLCVLPPLRTPRDFPIHSYPDGVVANADRIEVAMRWHQMSERTLENRGAPPRDRQVAEAPNSVQDLSFCQLR